MAILATRQALSVRPGDFDMENFGKIIYTIFGGVITLAIISVIISKKSEAPQVIQAGSSALANIVAAAVNPVNTSSTNGNLGTTTFSTPNIPAPGNVSPSGPSVFITP